MVKKGGTSTDDFLEKNDFENIEQLRRKVPNASIRLIAKLDQYLGKRAEKLKPFTFTRVFKRKVQRKGVSYIVITRKQVTVYRDKKGRFKRKLE